MKNKLKLQTRIVFLDFFLHRFLELVIDLIDITLFNNIELYFVSVALHHILNWELFPFTELIFFYTFQNYLDQS